MKLDGPAAVIVYLSAMAIFGAVGLVVWMLATGELHVHNGYDDPIVVEVDGEQHRMDAHSAISLGDHLRGSLVVTALEPMNRRVIDQVEVTFVPFGADDIIVNPGGRGGFVQFEQEYIEDHVDSDVDTLAAPIWLGGRVIELEDVDYILAPVPDEVSISAGQGRVIKTAIEAIDEFASVIDVNTLYLEVPAELHLDMAMAALRRSPAHEGGWRVAGQYLSPEYLLALLEEIRAAHPDDAAAHLRYLDAASAAGVSDDELVAHYTDWLAEAPDDLGRKVLLALARRDWGDVLLQAFEEDPDHAITNYALGSEALAAGDLEDALDHFERFAAAGPDERAESAHHRMRLSRVLGQTWSPDLDAALRIDRGYEQEMHGLLMAWRAETQPQQFGRVISEAQAHVMQRHRVDQEGAMLIQERDRVLAALAAGRIETAQEYALDREDEDLRILIALGTGEGLDELLNDVGSDSRYLSAVAIAAAIARYEQHPRANDLSGQTTADMPCLAPLVAVAAPPTADMVQQTAAGCDADTRGLAWMLGWLRAPDHPAAAVWHAQARKWQWPGHTPLRDRWPRPRGAAAASD